MKYVTLATEDPVSEAVGRRLIKDYGGELEVIESLGGKGFGYLRSHLPNFRAIARFRPVLLITDLDRTRCPPIMLDDWLGPAARQRTLLFRIAVREIESWLLADRVALAAFLGVAARDIARTPESLADPKQSLLRACRRAPRTVRHDMLAHRGSLASQGIRYNSRLCEFVRERWSPERAANSSHSLQRARRRIAELSQQEA